MSRKMPSEKNAPSSGNCLLENYHQEIWYTGKFPPGNLPRPHLRKSSPDENCLPEKDPPKNCFSSFFPSFAVDIFKLFIVTSFRGVSSTPAAYVTDLCVTLINGMN